MATTETALLDRVRETLEQELRPLVDELFEEVIRGLGPGEAERSQGWVCTPDHP